MHMYVHMNNTLTFVELDTLPARKTFFNTLIILLEYYIIALCLPRVAVYPAFCDDCESPFTCVANGTCGCGHPGLTGQHCTEGM